MRHYRQLLGLDRGKSISGPSTSELRAGLNMFTSLREEHFPYAPDIGYRLRPELTLTLHWLYNL